MTIKLTTILGSDFMNCFHPHRRVANPRLVGFPSSLQVFVVKGPPLEVKFYLSFSLIFIAFLGEYVSIPRWRFFFREGQGAP